MPCLSKGLMMSTFFSDTLETMDESLRIFVGGIHANNLFMYFGCLSGPAPSSVGNGLAPIQPEDLKSVWLETFLLGFSVDPKVIKALETEEVTVKVLVDEGTEEGVYKLLRMVAEATGVKITVGQQARVWHAVRQWQDNKRKAQELEGAYRFFSWNSSTHFTGGYSFQDIYVYFSLVVYLF
jgi:hypothetical protein